MNNRRKLIIALGAATLVAPLHSFAQQSSKVWRVGFLSTRSRPTPLDSDIPGAFLRGMRELGYVEGKNLVIEWGFADGRYERLPGLATELVNLKVDVVVTNGTDATHAIKKATTTIPIVMVTVADPIGSGFAQSLAHPAGNITGITLHAGDYGPKHLEMLLGMVPTLSRVTVLVNPANVADVSALKSIQTAAQKARVKILPVEASTPQEIENAFSRMTREKAGAVIVATDGFFTQQARQIAELAAKNRLPSIYSFRSYADSGGLLSYGANAGELYRRAATYVDKIIKGAKPGDLPVEQPTTFELIINGKTAKALGLKIPQSLLVMADKVIE